MPDITMCSPTKIEKKCESCYRFNAKPDWLQAYSNFYEHCVSEDYHYYYKAL